MLGDPLTMGFLHLGAQWWVILILLALCFWGFAFGFFRRLWIKARRKLLVRAAGKLYCPECACALEDSACPKCSGKWIAAEVCGKKGLRWQKFRADFAGQERSPCPSCGADMERGGFEGRKYTAESCGACRGFWLSRIDRVSFELDV